MYKSWTFLKNSRQLKQNVFDQKNEVSLSELLVCRPRHLYKALQKNVTFSLTFFGNMQHWIIKKKFASKTSESA